MESAVQALPSFALLGGLSLIHLFIHYLRFLGMIPRPWWLSIAGGAAVAYVFVHILPGIAETQEVIEGRELGVLAATASHAYIIAMLGLLVFYGLERTTQHFRVSPSLGRRVGGQPAHFWVHAGSFAAFNAIVGYLLAQQTASPLDALLFALAMGLHFLTTDFGLCHLYEHAYEAAARWLFVAALTVGWALGLAITIDELAFGALLAFLGGGVVLNALKEEFPAERQTRSWPFVSAAILYAVLLVAL